MINLSDLYTLINIVNFVFISDGCTILVNCKCLSTCTSISFSALQPKKINQQSLSWGYHRIRVHCGNWFNLFVKKAKENNR